MGLWCILKSEPWPMGLTQSVGMLKEALALIGNMVLYWE